MLPQVFDLCVNEAGLHNDAFMISVSNVSPFLECFPNNNNIIKDFSIMGFCNFIS